MYSTGAEVQLLDPRLGSHVDVEIAKTIIAIEGLPDETYPSVSIADLDLSAVSHGSQV